MYNKKTDVLRKRKVNKLQPNCKILLYISLLNGGIETVNFLGLI